MSKIKTGKTLTSKELAEKHIKFQVERHKNPEKWRGLPFGLPKIDKITGGARRAELIAIAGSHKAGKTTFAMAIAKTMGYQLLDEEEHGLVVSLEMSFSVMGNRFIANAGHVEVNKLRDYTMEENDWDDYYHGAEMLKDLPVLWNVGCYSFEGLEALLDQYAYFEAENGKNTALRFVVVDYFQLMNTNASGKKRWEELQVISRNLKRLANKYDITIFLLSQQTRDALENEKKQRSSNTLAGTQGLVQDLDMLMMILPVMQDDKEVAHLREIWIAESRNSDSKSGETVLFSGKYSKMGPLYEGELEDLPPQEDEEERVEEWRRWLD